MIPAPTSMLSQRKGPPSAAFTWVGLFLAPIAREIVASGGAAEIGPAFRAPVIDEAAFADEGFEASRFRFSWAKV